MKYQIQIVAIHLAKVDMKIKIFIIVIVIIGLAFFLISDQIGLNNMEKAKSVRKGMTKNMLIELMGEPKTKGLSHVYLNEADSSYIYHAPFGSSEGVVITFDEAGKVIHVANE